MTCGFHMWKAMGTSVNNRSDTETTGPVGKGAAKPPKAASRFPNPAGPVGRALLGGDDLDGEDRLDLVEELDLHLVCADRADRLVGLYRVAGAGGGGSSPRYRGECPPAPPRRQACPPPPAGGG